MVLVNVSKNGGEKMNPSDEPGVIIIRCIFRFAGLLAVCFTAAHIAGLIW